MGTGRYWFRLLLRSLEFNAAMERKVREVLDAGKSDEVAMFFQALKGGAVNLSASRPAENARSPKPSPRRAMSRA